MAAKPSSRTGTKSVNMTPLMPRGSARKPTQSKPLFAYSRPAARGMAHSVSNAELQAIKTAKTPINRQTLARKVSVPDLQPSEGKLPKIRSRASSDPELVAKVGKDTQARLAPNYPPKPPILRCLCVSQVGTIMGRPKPNNQDAQFYTSSSLSGTDFALLGVCDGHGTTGHFVSSYMTKNLPARIREEHSHRVGRAGDIWTGTMVESFQKCNADLKYQNFDSICSGCTCVVVAITGTTAICANVGDSRAVLGRKTASGMVALPLSRDQKPDVPEERQRIVDCGGRVEPVFGIGGEPVGPPRVWLKNEDAPGLAMSRAMGDFIASKIGVISTPGTL